MPQSPKLIIFDLDGTLTDSLADLTDAVNHMLAFMGRSALTQEQIRKMVGQGARNLVQRALASTDEADVDRGLAVFLAYNDAHIADKTTLYPGVFDIMDSLVQRGTRMALISNKNVALCRKLLNTLGAGHFFELILGGDSLPERKPSPAPILRVLADTGFAAGDAIMVGDSINDMAAGKGAGVITVGCSYGYGDIEELADADYRIAAFPELLKLPLFGKE